MREKITFFLPSLEPGGTERNVVNLVSCINKEQYDISLLLGSKEGDFINEVNATVSIVALNASLSPKLFFRLVKYFKTQKPDIFVSAFPRINIIALAAKLFSGSHGKIVITEHSVFSMLPVIAKNNWRRFFARVFMPLLAKIFYPKADSIICVSRGIAQDLSSIIGSAAKIDIVYNPIINDTVYKLADLPVEHPWFADPRAPIVLAAGRLVSCKDYPTMLKAFALVVKTSPAHLVILGSGPEKEALEHFADKIGLSGQVAFLGFVKNPYAYMKRSSVFALSSLQEGFGNVIIEAMACGTPVVSTDCPVGPGEIITHGENGMLVPMRNPEALAKSIIELLGKPSLRQALSAAGKKMAESFSVKKSVQDYEKIFQRLKVNL